ncbi:TetR/AcrR family transcriptional regulator [Candidatus Methylacidithermus pantelleriae]|uniref:HTH-type transcriptional repressor n=1 Tax=Candidatus Methylacidithermus pantelleriae TaxID=2744239 RepID=A0A8J2BPJ1_9BACT|nr:TetR/AcrR family transcriptional regulator [Candidatus Methylacidithermus pantelleriae]CAF0704482.1 HTH-type transcriptional repressor [Candidatus Methylacidithermus pantelleriae]
MRQAAKAQNTADRILQAAVELFSAHGFRGTTTRKIAQQAGVNEALIFRYFPNKETLYAAIIQKKIQECPLTPGKPFFAQPPAEPEAFFQALGEEVLRAMEEDPQFVRLLYFSALEGHQLAGMFYEAFTHHLHRLTADYILQKQKEGRLRRVPPLLAARAFFGMLVHYYLGKRIFGMFECGSAQPAMDLSEVVKTFVELFCHGVVARSSPA